MSERFTYSTTISFDTGEGGPDYDVTISYSVSWGTPESGTHNCPPEDYDPGSATVVEDVRLETVDGKPRPWGMYHGYVPNEDDEFETTVLDDIDEDELIANAAEIIESRRPD